MLTLAAFTLVLGLIIFVHEAGHFVMAKVFGMTPTVFSFGFGKRLFGVNIGGTDCRVSLIPLGGYVKLEGEGSESDAPGSFSKAARWKRLIVYMAGPGMNFVLALAIYTALYMTPHTVVVGTLIVKDVATDSPAQSAGARPGDEIIAIDGHKVTKYEDLVNTVQSGKSSPYILSIKRDTGVIEMPVVPVYNEEIKRYLVGIIFDNKLENRQLAFLPAMQASGSRCYEQTNLIFRYFGKLFKGEVEIKKSVGGPLMIAKASGEAARAGWGALLSFIAFMSIQIGIINFLPIAPIDGGHMATLLVEMGIRRDLSKETKVILINFGALIVFALMGLALFNDFRPYILKFFGFGS